MKTVGPVRGLTAAVALTCLLVLLPVAGAVLTSAPWLWPILTPVLAVSLLFLTGSFQSRGKRNGSRLLLFNALFFLNLGYFFSYCQQDEGFNDAFFYHLKPDLLYAGVGEFATLAACLIIVFLAINLFSFKAGSASRWRPGRPLTFVTTSLLALASFALLPPTVSLGRHFYPDVIPDLPPFLAGDKTPKRTFIPNDPRILTDLADKPHLSSQKPEKRSHLVLLYLESVEQKYFNQTLFPNLLPALTELRATSIHFPNMRQAKGASWTIAGIVASQCGYPLLSSFRGGANDLGILPTFMPKAICLGDLLREAGYALAFLGGADHRFAGKGKFLRSHGFGEVKGFADLADRLADPGYRNSWGLFDDALLDMAYDQFVEMAKGDEPVALSVLTLDTHHPTGHASASCKPYLEIDNKILQAVHCTDQLIFDFIRRLRETPYAKDTYIVVMSDHLAMRNSATGMLQSGGEPRQLTFFVNAPEQAGKTIESEGLHYDVAPTILDLLDVQIEGQLGLGRSLLRQDGYLPAFMGADAASRALPNKALNDHIATLWSFPSMTVDDGIDVDVDKGSVAFGGHNFDLLTKHGGKLLPTLFSFDADDLHLTGLYQANPGDDEPDLLTTKIMNDASSIHLAIGSYRYLRSLVNDASADGSLQHLAKNQDRLDEEDMIVLLGKGDAKGVIARPSAEPFEIPGAAIAKLAR